MFYTPDEGVYICGNETGHLPTGYVVFEHEVSNRKHSHSQSIRTCIVLPNQLDHSRENPHSGKGIWWLRTLGTDTGRGMFDDSEELEDEIVECDALVDRALELLEAVEAMYFPPEEAPAPAQSEPSPGRAAAEPAPPAGSVSVSPTPKAAARMAARKAERRKEARKSWLQVLLVLAGIALAFLLIAISSD